MFSRHNVDTVDGFEAKHSHIAKLTYQKKLEKGMIIVLNKSLKDEVVNYAKNVSCGVIGLKSSVRMTLGSICKFEPAVAYNTQKFTLSQIERNLDGLANAYNANVAFLEDQQHSEELRTFARGLRDRLFQDREKLELIGLSFEDGSGNLQFNRRVLSELSQLEIYSVMDVNTQIFHSLYKKTLELLVVPLSSHMHFKGLNYHYNYRIGHMVEEGFSAIESGMIVNKAV